MNIKKLSILCITIFVISGCASKGTQEDTAADEALAIETPTEEGSTSSPIGTEASGALGESTAENMNVDPGNSLRDEKIIYFDYDSSQLEETTRAIIDAHADYLLNNPDLQVTLEGHADERGSREYNLALGEKRANVVKRALMIKGVQKSQINSISFGEEKPQVDNHTEEAWSSNRRAVFVYATNE